MPELRTWLGVLCVIAGCTRAAPRELLPLELESAIGVVLDPRAIRPPPGYAPLRLATASLGQQSNPAPNIPAACYARTSGTSNPCATCHTRSKYPNLADDWELQMNYSFEASSLTNPWRNQFRDRRALVARFSDDDVLAYIRTDNYAPLRDALANEAVFPGWRPDVDLARGFDENGFAVDGSGWRTIRYKPFGSFWPTNGSTGDVFIRLPAEFRRDAGGRPSLAAYIENLAILETTIGGDPRRTDAELGLPAFYAGGAAGVRVVRALYPQGTEFLHTVRYLDPDAPAFISRRMKEVRYAKKVAFLEGKQLADEHAAAESPNPPDFEGDALHGLRGAGWQLQGFIEDANGWLRLQTNEEHRFCMGCHGGLGATVDHTFAFARKLPGAEGWRAQDPHGIPDVPQVGQTDGEYAQYFERVGGGDDFRANGELRDRRTVARDNIAGLVFPSRGRALALDRAYLANVIEQSYVWGRDASVTPVPNVHPVIGTRSTGLGEADRIYRDVRSHLDWSRNPRAARR